MEASSLAILGCLLLLATGTQCGQAQDQHSRVAINKTDDNGSSRQGKLFPVFQIITFPNTVCNSGSTGRNGTCYTADECNSLGGSSSGTCADGFGVCCIFSLSCGSTSSQNCTYLVQSSTSSLSQNPCTYTICRCSSNICRIRFDFNTFNIANPEVGTTADAGATTALVGASIGDCLTDQFSITSPGNRGSPIICGLNSGQHSPDGCLQYFTGTTGTVSSFNFPSGTVTSTTTHLSDQCYSICFRRESSYCAICFAPSITLTTAIATANMQNSFGLSIANGGADASSTEANCVTDYIVIRNGVDIDPATPLVIGTLTSAAGVGGRICGRAFSAEEGTTATIAYADPAGATTRVSVCTQVTPFQIDVKFDEDEPAVGMAAATDEQAVDAGGIVGFSLNYAQIMC